MKLYGNHKSGNVYKISLLLHLLGRNYQEVHIGLGPDSASRSSEFLALNPLGQIPVLETEDGRPISQSNAILWYLAHDSHFLPEDKYDQAIVMQWMCFEQYELEPNLAWSRWICYLMNKQEERAEDLRRYHKSAYNALDIMEAQLLSSPYIASEDTSIADLALFAYTHNCHQGGLSLEGYPAIRIWLEKITMLDGFFPMSEQFLISEYK